MLKYIYSFFAFFILWAAADLMIGPIGFNTAPFWFLFVLFTALVTAIDYAIKK